MHQHGVFILGSVNFCEIFTTNIWSLSLGKRGIGLKLVEVPYLVIFYNPVDGFRFIFLTAWLWKRSNKKYCSFTWEVGKKLEHDVRVSSKPAQSFLGEQNTFGYTYLPASRHHTKLPTYRHPREWRTGQLGWIWRKVVDMNLTWPSR